MILVSLGTQDKEFPRLLKLVEDLIDKGIIKDEVIAQIGQTKYESNKMKLVKFLNKDELLKYIKESKYIITHGGVGTILDSLSLNKKVIAVARLKKYKEHVNDHQLEIIEEFSKEGYIIDGSNNLEEAISKINSFTPKKYKSNNDNFVNIIKEFIDNN